jgi:hypothetical protein
MLNRKSYTSSVITVIIIVVVIIIPAFNGSGTCI